MFQTSNGWYDGTYVLDPIKQLPNDIGRFVQPVADLGIMSNAYATNYVQNICSLVAGFYSQIDPKSAIWNKPLQFVTQVPGLVYKPTPARRPDPGPHQRPALQGIDQSSGPAARLHRGSAVQRLLSAASDRLGAFLLCQACASRAAASPAV